MDRQTMEHLATENAENDAELGEESFPAPQVGDGIPLLQGGVGVLELQERVPAPQVDEGVPAQHVDEGMPAPQVDEVVHELQDGVPALQMAGAAPDQQFQPVAEINMAEVSRVWGELYETAEDWQTNTALTPWTP